MKTRYKNVTVAPDRHGKLRARYRKRGRSVYMKHLPDQAGFQDEYDALDAGASPIDRGYISRSINDLVSRYYRSADFLAKGNDQTRRTRRGIIEGFRAEFGDDLVVNFTFEHIEAILLAKTQKKKNDKGRIIGGQVAATNLREELLRIFRYAEKLEWRLDNPVEKAESVGKAKLSGYYSWSEDDIIQYKRRHPLGSKARLALEIILWTGQRRGDAAIFGRQHIVDGKIYYKASKNGAELSLPYAPDLRRAIESMPVIGADTFLVTDFGLPFSKAGFGNKMREWCDEAGLPRCTAHGLRKAIARRAAQAEASQAGLKAVGGWKGDDEVRIYTEAVEQEHLAQVTIARVVKKFGGDES